MLGLDELGMGILFVCIIFFCYELFSKFKDYTTIFWDFYNHTKLQLKPYGYKT